MIKFLKQKNKGFTIVETIVALFIFSVSITAMMAVFSSGIQNTNFAKRKIIASYLAQEGIEYIRNLRDNFIYFGETGNDWELFLKKLSGGGCSIKGCYFDDSEINFSANKNEMIDNLIIKGCEEEKCPELRYDSNGAKYNYQEGENSGFSRKIQIEFPFDEPSSDALKIISTVSFSNGSVSFSEYVYNLTPPVTP